MTVLFFSFLFFIASDLILTYLLSHAMRKSGIYTSLDFAPPARFKNDTGSDTGSIRSNHSGISAVHTHNIRTGAYRVSRLPPEMVGTKDDLYESLRPTMDLRR